MTSSLRMALALLCASIAGCLPESKNPIASPRDSFLDVRLEGAWQAREDGESPAYYHFRHQKSAPWIRIISVGPEQRQGLSVISYDALSTRLGAHTYLSFRALSEDGKIGRSGYNFARYDFDWLGRLRIYALVSESELGDAVRSRRLRGTVKGTASDAHVKLTDTSAHIAAFIVASDAKRLFDGKPMLLRKTR